MAIPFDLREIDARLDAMKSQKERVRALGNFLFEIKKQSAEFDFADAKKLERLKPITDGDFQKYHAIFDSGNLISLNPQNDRWNARKFENIALLRERVSLENKFYQLQSVAKLIQAKLDHEAEKPRQSSSTPAKAEPTTFLELFTDPHWADCFRHVLRSLQPALLDASDNWVGPHGTKGCVPMLIEEIAKNGGMAKCSVDTRAYILNNTFPDLKINSREFRLYTAGRYKKLEDKIFDIKCWVSDFTANKNFSARKNPEK